ncbi:hypothetical protein GOARA_045_00490 [Gordonia araii NBRC 100433]|uniref:DUF2599 domain-containing protein n=1 Tax=Gordonia araii NBRC 100433 TaxID=1073574 RepID=G7H1H0_9ACTN|nr:DUF2599 domain-containing protein [Gordonia araii]NNG97796.1 DUF2599 domain-containing protein [Gordonia araii NBRC 100433]GAB09695.1 hypothetical protein GOARA_045_00490 [Gordonia araii NBRC 100433]
MGLRRWRAALVAMVALTTLGTVGCGTDGDRGSDATPVATVPSVEESPTAADSDDGDATPSEPVVYLPPPYIARTVWVETMVGPSLQVYPTAAGRRVTTPDAQGKAWAEVVRKSTRYDGFSARSKGMRAQFDCHWIWARAVQPDKPSWNLEPRRPVVTDDQMIATRCNPGAPEE